MAIFSLDKQDKSKHVIFFFMVLKFRKAGSKVEIIGKSEATATIIDMLAVHDKPHEAQKLLAAH